MSTESARPISLVTGASSGLGVAFAERLARDGNDLIVTSRRKGRLAELARRLEAEYSVQAEVIDADLTAAAQLLALEERIAQSPPLEYLINNAGFGAFMPFVDLDTDRAEELIRLQVVAVTRLTRAALPPMIASGRGAVINVSSKLAFSGALHSPPLPKRATYAGTKAYINTFTQILSDELQGTGVKIQALCPGVVETEFHPIMGIGNDSFPPGALMSPENVVTASFAGLQLGEVICVPPLDDPELLIQIEEAQRIFVEQSRRGTPASRYLS